MNDGSEERLMSKDKDIAELLQVVRSGSGMHDVSTDIMEALYAEQKRLERQLLELETGLETLGRAVPDPETSEPIKGGV